MQNPIFKEDQLKSIIRIIERLLKRVRWCSLSDKKRIFTCVIAQSDICEYVKAQMISNAEMAETEDAFIRYMRNSKHYYETRRRLLLRNQKKYNRAKTAKKPKKATLSKLTKMA